MNECNKARFWGATKWDLGSQRRHVQEQEELPTFTGHVLSTMYQGQQFRRRKRSGKNIQLKHGSRTGPARGAHLHP